MAVVSYPRLDRFNFRRLVRGGLSGKGPAGRAFQATGWNRGIILQHDVARLEPKGVRGNEADGAIPR